MVIKRRILVVLVVGAVMLALGSEPGPSDPGVAQAATSWTLQGRVYEGVTGVEPPTSTPIQGVTVSLYCSNNYGQQGTLLRSTTTDR